MIPMAQWRDIHARLEALRQFLDTAEQTAPGAGVFLPFATVLLLAIEILLERDTEVSRNLAGVSIEYFPRIHRKEFQFCMEFGWTAKRHLSIIDTLNLLTDRCGRGDGILPVCQGILWSSLKFIRHTGSCVQMYLINDSSEEPMTTLCPDTMVCLSSGMALSYDTPPRLEWTEVQLAALPREADAA